ncbi:MAG: hypothetical protein ACWA42_00410 [Lutibacter sp.]
MKKELLEKELKKRWVYPYQWKRKQNNYFDRKTNFIYKINQFSLLEEKIQTTFKKDTNFEGFKNYALNRWYNFWSAKAIEKIFCENSKVRAHQNPKDKFVDFFIENIPFDHKTTVYPLSFHHSVQWTKENPEKLIKWLYANQSTQQRMHFKNRIFLVLVNQISLNESWKLKAEINWLQQIVSSYLRTFNPQNLKSISLNNKLVKSDIIWAIK